MHARGMTLRSGFNALEKLEFEIRINYLQH